MDQNLSLQDSRKRFTDSSSSDDELLSRRIKSRSASLDTTFDGKIYSILGNVNLSNAASTRDLAAGSQDQDQPKQQRLQSKIQNKNRLRRKHSNKPFPQGSDSGSSSASPKRFSLDLESQRHSFSCGKLADNKPLMFNNIRNNNSRYSQEDFNKRTNASVNKEQPYQKTIETAKDAIIAMRNNIEYANIDRNICTGPTKPARAITEIARHNISGIVDSTPVEPEDECNGYLDYNYRNKAIDRSKSSKSQLNATCNNYNNTQCTNCMSKNKSSSAELMSDTPVNNFPYAFKKYPSQKSNQQKHNQPLKSRFVHYVLSAPGVFERVFGSGESSKLCNQSGFNRKAMPVRDIVEQSCEMLIATIVAVWLAAANIKGFISYYNQEIEELSIGIENYIFIFAPPVALCVFAVHSIFTLLAGSSSYRIVGLLIMALASLISLVFPISIQSTTAKIVISCIGAGAVYSSSVVSLCKKLGSDGRTLYTSILALNIGMLVSVVSSLIVSKTTRYNVFSKKSSIIECLVIIFLSIACIAFKLGMLDFLIKSRQLENNTPSSHAPISATESSATIVQVEATGDNMLESQPLQRSYSARSDSLPRIPSSNEQQADSRLIMLRRASPHRQDQDLCSSVDDLFEIKFLPRNMCFFVSNMLFLLAMYTIFCTLQLKVISNRETSLLRISATNAIIMLALATALFLLSSTASIKRSDNLGLISMSILVVVFSLGSMALKYHAVPAYILVITAVATMILHSTLLPRMSTVVYNTDFVGLANGLLYSLTSVAMITIAPFQYQMLHNTITESGSAGASTETNTYTTALALFSAGLFVMSVALFAAFNKTTSTKTPQNTYD